MPALCDVAQRMVVYIYFIPVAGNSISSQWAAPVRATVWYGKGSRCDPSITYKITPAGSFVLTKIIVYCLEHLRPYGQQAGNETVRLQESTHEGKRQSGSSFKFKFLVVICHSYLFIFLCFYMLQTRTEVGLDCRMYAVG
jgi:branched-subunit amino acid ABC-type transport system permease component